MDKIEFIYLYFVAFMRYLLSAIIRSDWIRRKEVLPAFIVPATVSAFSVALFTNPNLGVPLQQIPTPTPGPWGYALQFNGNGVNDIDRVKIALDPQTPIDVDKNFTLEWWIKASLQDNRGVATCGSGNGWINGSIIFDRDVFGQGDYGDYGVSLTNGRIAFGVSNGSTSVTLCGLTTVADSVWHHVAVTRNGSTGQLSIYVDGAPDAVRTGPAGSISYRNGRATSYPNSDPYLVIGAEKHDVGSQFQSYRGIIDEFRLSNTIRYTGTFARPSSPFNPDSFTVGLYHFNEGSGTTAFDSATVAGAPTHGTLHVGGNPVGPVYITSSVGQASSVNADLSVVQSDAPDPVVVNNNVTYTIIVTNNGPDTATGVTVVDTLPVSASLVSATPSQGRCLPTGGLVSCNIGVLSSGARATVTVVVLPTAVGAIFNQASVASIVVDLNTGNNTNSANTWVVPPPTATYTPTNTYTPSNTPTPLTATPTATASQPAAPPAFTPAPSLTPSETLTPSNTPLPSDTPTATNTAFLLPTATATETPPPSPPPFNP